MDCILSQPTAGAKEQLCYKKAGQALGFSVVALSPTDALLALKSMLLPLHYLFQETHMSQWPLEEDNVWTDLEINVGSQLSPYWKYFNEHIFVSAVFSCSLGDSSQRSKKTLGQKLLDMLPSENSSKRTEDQDDPQAVFRMLIDLLNDKEEALAHQRKVSYMLARALEEKDTASKENKNKNLMKENFLLKNLWPKTSEFSLLHDPVHSSVQIINSVGCICSIQQPQLDPNNTRTLKRAHSLPSGIS